MYTLVFKVLYIFLSFFALAFQANAFKCPTTFAVGAFNLDDVIFSEFELMNHNYFNVMRHQEGNR